MILFQSIALLSLLVHSTVAQDSSQQVVADDFAEYVGYVNSGTGITIWRGIQYGKPPLPSQDGSKNLRFQVPFDPVRNQGRKDNKQVKSFLGPCCGSTNLPGQTIVSVVRHNQQRR